MRRAFALLQAAWLALLIAEPASLHACAMHAMGHGAHASPSATATAPAGSATEADEHAHHEHEGHAHGGVALDDTSAPVPDDGASSTCQCLGECCAAATAAPVDSPEIPAVARIAATPARIETVAHVATRAPDLRLPFSNGPPETLTP